MKDLVLVALLVVGLLALSLGGWGVQSFFEANAYNEITGKNVSTWQAMWLNLRIDCD